MQGEELISPVTSDNTTNSIYPSIHPPGCDDKNAKHVEWDSAGVRAWAVDAWTREQQNKAQQLSMLELFRHSTHSVAIPALKR
jgi:hypothetical protein